MEEFLLSHFKPIILKILEDENEEKHFSVNINFLELFEHDTSLGRELLKNPEKCLDELENWVLHVQDIIFQQLKDDGNLSFKDNVHARVYGLPACPELHRTVFPRANDLDLFLQIKGTVMKTKDPKMLEYQRPYKCTKCKYVEMVAAIYEHKYVIQGPKRCSNPESCPGRNLISVEGLSVENCKDYQEIKIQEQASKVNSSMPASMWVTLEDDLVDICKPGDDVTICGIIKRRWGPLVVGKLIDCELALQANHVQVHNSHSASTLITFDMRNHFNLFWKKYQSDPLQGRDIILKSFCPQLYGMYLVKLAVVVVLAGANNVKDRIEIGGQKRSEAHILLVGDPGTGKSQLLRYASKLIHRSVLTTGVGTTSAGLTAAAVMEDGQWQLEAGALVLADGGICCIDEFNSMKPNDRASIHEAMEQQTISVAKAGIHCKLRTRCSILAATNPKGGHLDAHQSLSLNLAIPSPLLSRFDVVLMLKDSYNAERDELIATHVLSEKYIKPHLDKDELWSMELLQQYFSVIKSFSPVLTPMSDQILAAYYQTQRRESTRNKSRTTVRLLESLIRLCQGHARLMCHTEVLIMDAIFAIVLIECSMHGECAVLSLNPLNVLESYVDDPMGNYVKTVTAVLSKLELHDILAYEMQFIRENYKVLADTKHVKEMDNNNRDTSPIKQCKNNRYSDDLDMLKKSENVPVTTNTVVSLDKLKSNNLDMDVDTNGLIRNDVPTESQNRYKRFKFQPKEVRDLSKRPHNDESQNVQKGTNIVPSTSANTAILGNTSSCKEEPESNEKVAIKTNFFCDSIFETAEESFDFLDIDI